MYTVSSEISLQGMVVLAISKGTRKIFLLWGYIPNAKVNAILEYHSGIVSTKDSLDPLMVPSMVLYVDMVCFLPNLRLHHHLLLHTIRYCAPNNFHKSHKLSQDNFYRSKYCHLRSIKPQCEYSELNITHIQKNR